MTGTEEIREQFYADLDTELGDTPATDKLVMLGDFNARVGRDAEQWRGVTGKHGVGKINSNDLLLLSKCAEHNLLITNTIFRLADKYKTSWMHLLSKQWHLIDYIITRQRNSSDVLITRAMLDVLITRAMLDVLMTRAMLDVLITRAMLDALITRAMLGVLITRAMLDVLITRAMWGAECWTDHRFIRPQIRPKIHDTVRYKRTGFVEPS